MRITSRTPPVRLPAAALTAIAALPAEHAGMILRWGMALYMTGDAPSAALARVEARMDERSWATLIDGATRLLDAEALRHGRLSVTAFAEAAEARDRVSAARVRTPVGRKDAAAVRAVVNAPADRHPVPATDAVKASIQLDVDAQRDDMVATLVARNVDAREASRTVDRWIADNGTSRVYDAIADLANRRIARPIPYLDRVLENDRAQRKTDMPSEIRLANRGSVMPRPIHKRVRVGPKAAWEMLGWTARGHRRDGGRREARLEIWRTDAGTLAYQKPEEGTTIPDYDEDPGLYEHE